MKQNDIQTVYAVGRQFLYLVLIFMIVYGMHFLTKVYGIDTFEEGSVVENIQFGLLLASSVIFLLQTAIYKHCRSLLFLLASCSLLAACRELDAVLDKIIPVVHWKFAFIFPVVAFVYAFMHRDKLSENLLKFFRFPAFYMMYLAFIVILPLAQCIGHGPFVRSALGLIEVASIKQLYEEAAETVGYFLVFLSSIELFFDLRLKDK